LSKQTQGANSGLGFEAKRGCTVVMCCRSVDKAQNAQAEILKRSEVSDAKQLPIVQLDLQDLDNVGTFRARYDSIPAIARRPIDMLILNAGVMAPHSYVETKEGLESQWGTNVIGHFKFARCMLDLCKAAPSSRIVVISSLLHRFAFGIDFETFDHKEKYSAWKIYCQTKLAEMLFVFKLNRYLIEHEIDNVIAVAAHPGFSYTQYQGNNLLLMLIGPVFAQSAEVGAMSTVLAATDPTAVRNGFCGPSHMFGFYGHPKWDQGVSNLVFDEKLQDELWTKCEEYSRCSFP